ncbi:hypothetical protein C481_16346 [Natrialba asiatica DSM 12278]|uniref:Uncharacterized protein n=1 Tax=Natrialba asiatica (strain ATCC 700177 / DSM 12278 / JCM 9576 / FERM P-10747 / NBRC 102637 / 172P1) TaxID=29540 RepID=M0AJK7_NATA1|nr:hypothetical protein C481_16346 [Natrialba asiatica DSM 12278]
MIERECECESGRIRCGFGRGQLRSNRWCTLVSRLRTEFSAQPSKGGFDGRWLSIDRFELGFPPRDEIKRREYGASAYRPRGELALAVGGPDRCV